MMDDEEDWFNDALNRDDSEEHRDGRVTRRTITWSQKGDKLRREVKWDWYDPTIPEEGD